MYLINKDLRTHVKGLWGVYTTVEDSKADIAISFIKIVCDAFI